MVSAWLAGSLDQSDQADVLDRFRAGQQVGIADVEFVSQNSHYVIVDLPRHIVLLGFAGTDLVAQPRVSDAEALTGVGAAQRRLFGAQDRIEPGPLFREGIVLTAQFASHDADGVGRHAGVERARAFEVGREVFEEVFEGFEEFVGGRAVLHAGHYRGLAGPSAFC